MPKSTLAISLAFAGFLTGCGTKVDMSNPGTPPPHGGILMPMPAGKGFVEVVKGTAPGPEVSFFFLKDGKSLFSPAPTGGTLAVATGKLVALSRQGDGLVTPPGPLLFQDGEPTGNVIVDLEGSKVTIPLDVR